MKLADHVGGIKNLIEKSFDNQFVRIGIGASVQKDISTLDESLHFKRKKIDVLIKNHTSETGSYSGARDKAIDELTFTLFNRIASIKVMESHHIFPPIITKEAEQGDRSFGHKAWLEQNPEKKSEEIEGIRDYIKFAFNQLGESIPLFHKSYPYAILPYVIDLNEIIEAFNAIEKDAQIKDNVWGSDDILGWLYESYNSDKKQTHKDSKAKTEYNKVSLQSQVYTPRWVVEFLVQNSLGKLYLEMYPGSEIKEQFKIANPPEKKIRELKPLHEVKLIDPASGSGNFLLYAFEFFHKLYEDQIENYGADYDEDDIPQLIIENNLFGVDLDDRAIQLAQLGLWIKAKKLNRNIGKLQFNVVSSDFFLPDFMLVEAVFKKSKLDSVQLEVVEDIWSDLQQAYKFGSLVRIEEKINLRLGQQVDASKNELFQDGTLFEDQFSNDLKQFKQDFISNCEEAFERFAMQSGNSFLTDKTKDAITFLRLITQKYDVATANPPYTDSSDFGPDLKKFVEANYKKPYAFHTNLYATFIKRCFELTNEEGMIALLHPLTFMYIKSFEDVRKYILTKTSISVLAELGLGGVFANSDVQVDVTMYVLEKQQFSLNSLFFDLKEYKNHSNKPFIFQQAYAKFLNEGTDSHAYLLDQSKFKIIKSYPFIYWISDEFREKFKSKSIDELLKVRQGIATGNNNRCLRFWWEVEQDELSTEINDNKKWVGYSKGGPYQKWHGNMWLVVDFSEDGYDYLLNNGNHLPSKEYYYLKGLTYSASGSKGASFRFLTKNNVFDVGGSCIFPFEYKNVEYSIAFMNSKLCFYIIGCLNPTVNTQVGDLKRVPFVVPKADSEAVIASLSKRNVDIIQHLKSFLIYERNYALNPINKGGTRLDFKARISKYFSFDNYLSAHIAINEAIINDKIFEVYELTEVDKAMVLTKEGESIGALPVSQAAKAAYLANEVTEFPLDNIREYIQNLPKQEFEPSIREAIENEFPQLYKGNNDLEEFCIRHQINPINVWYWFKESNINPKQRMNDFAMEFLADLLREILMEDDDGIIPLVPNAGEKVLLDRIEEKFIEKEYSLSQYASFGNILGEELNDYINNHFFGVFAFHLKLFKRLPAAPFIWHLTSGPMQGFDCYIIIYKWNQDKLMSIRSVYIEKRERALNNRQTDLANDESAKAQNEKDLIYKQLKEIEVFKEKIDQLLAEGYDPILDDGVGKNIAPLQNKKMLAYDVLNSGQLKKYLNADW